MLGIEKISTLNGNCTAISYNGNDDFYGRNGNYRSSLHIF
ncbi:hypothetical protein [Azospirillum argentinense]